jgi:hypothetical protein
MTEEKKGLFNMMGEFCREAAVLIFVFGNLDFWLSAIRAKEHTVVSDATSYTLKVFELAIVFQTTGMLFEKWRKS